MRVYFITQKDLGPSVILKPRIPESSPEYEGRIQRICVSSSILGALSSIGNNLGLECNTYIYKCDLDESEIIKRLNWNSRDNARRPICWDDSTYGGFSNHEPWIKLDTNKDLINVKKDLLSENSIYKYYSKIFDLRNKNEVFTIGEYELVELNDSSYIYKRKRGNEEFLVIISFVDHNKINTYGFDKIVLSNSKYEEIPSEFKKLDAIVLKK